MTWVLRTPYGPDEDDSSLGKLEERTQLPVAGIPYLTGLVNVGLN